jgi:hypothetical protein
MDVKMKLISKIFAVSSIALASISANAELISTDWKTSGDSLATLDESTGLEWLDLTQTINMSINQAEDLMNSTFAGWRLPTRSEVTQLMVNAFPSQAKFVEGEGGRSIANATLDNETDNFRFLFGTTYATSTYEFSYGLFENDVIDARYSLLYSGAADKISDDSVSLFSNYGIGTDNDHTHTYIGVYLVSGGGTTLSSINDPSINNGSANVPLPATAALLGLGLLGFGARRKNNS